MSVTVTRRALTEADNAKLAELESQISPVGKLSLFTAMGCVAVYLGAFIALVLFMLGVLCFMIGALLAMLVAMLCRVSDPTPHILWGGLAGVAIGAAWGLREKLRQRRPMTKPKAPPPPPPPERLEAVVLDGMVEQVVCFMFDEDTPNRWFLPVEPGRLLHLSSFALDEAHYEHEFPHRRFELVYTSDGDDLLDYQGSDGAAEVLEREWPEDASDDLIKALGSLRDGDVLDGDLATFCDDVLRWYRQTAGSKRSLSRSRRSEAAKGVSRANEHPKV